MRLAAGGEKDEGKKTSVHGVAFGHIGGCELS